MRIDIIHTRDPDSECDHEVWVDGQRTGFAYKDGEYVKIGPSDLEVNFYDFDPGAGYETDELAEMRQSDIDAAPEFLKGRIAEVWDSYMPTYEKWGL